MNRHMNRNCIARHTLLMACMLGLASTANAESEPKPGLYEMHMSVNMPGMPAMPPRTHQMCFTEQDFDSDPAKAGMPAMEENCEVTEQSRSGNTATWNMRCTGAQAMEVKGTAVFSGDSFTTTLNMSGDFGTGQTMKMTQTNKATRIGDCSESSIPR